MSGRTPAQRRALIGLGVVIAIAIVAAIVVRPSPDDVEELFNGSGAIGPLLFAGAYALLTVAVVPASPLTIASGALYGVAGGAALSVVGATTGALAAFLVARRATGNAQISARGGRLGAIQRRLEGRGLLALLSLRLVPVVPFSALNYASAASGISTRDYAIATGLGIIPGALLYAAIGAGLSNPFSTVFIGAAVAAVLLALVARRYSGAVVPEEGDGTEVDEPGAAETTAEPGESAESATDRSAGASTGAAGKPSTTSSGAEQTSMLDRRDRVRFGLSLAFFLAALATLAALTAGGLFH